jgi:hypothetical protein
MGGCSPTPPAVKTVPASGVITMKGAPVPDALVTFYPVDSGGRPAGGVTGPDGRYQLKTALGGEKSTDGAMAGSYNVTVEKSKGTAESSMGTRPVPTKTGESAEEMEKKKKEMEGPAVDPSKKPEAGSQTSLPAKYADPKTTDLNANVKAGEKNDFAFDLEG